MSAFNTAKSIFLAIICTGCNAAFANEELRFRVLLDDDEIGFHSFRVANEGNRQIVDISADFTVTFLAIPVYSYEHRNREVYSKGCLDQIASSTDDNGDRFAVNGTSEGGVFSLTTHAAQRQIEAPCVMSFAYWNADFLNQSRLLNAQNGEYLPVSVDYKGMETLQIDEQTVPAKRYSVRNPEKEIDITVWYSEDAGKWLSLESRVSDGKIIRYLPVGARTVAQAGAPAAVRAEQRSRK